jgi:hypothetical protein
VKLGVVGVEDRDRLGVICGWWRVRGGEERFSGAGVQQRVARGCLLEDRDTPLRAARRCRPLVGRHVIEKLYDRLDAIGPKPR